MCRCHLAGKTRSNDLWALDAASRIGLSCASTTSVECFPKTEAVNPSVTDKSKYIPLDVPEPTRWASSWKVTPSQEEWWWCERPKYQSQKMKYRTIAWWKSFVRIFLIGFTLPGQSFSLDFNLDDPTLKPVEVVGEHWTLWFRIEENHRKLLLVTYRFRWITGLPLLWRHLVTSTFQLTKGPMLKAKGLHSRLSWHSVHSWCETAINVCHGNSCPEFVGSGDLNGYHAADFCQITAA